MFDLNRACPFVVNIQITYNMASFREQLVQWLITLFLPDAKIVLPLLLQSRFVDIQPRIEVVEVCQLWYICDSFVGLLQSWDTDGHIICRSQVLPILILQVLLVDIEEQLSIISSQVAYSERVLAVFVILDYGWMEGTGIAQFAIRSKEIRVDEPDTFLLEDRIKQFEHLLAEKLVISVNNHKNVCGRTEAFGSKAQIRHCEMSFLLNDYPILIRFQLGLILENVQDGISCSISGSIIDNNYLKVSVILHEDGPDVAVIPSSWFVVESWHHNTESQLLILADLILFFVVLPLLKGDWCLDSWIHVDNIPPLSRPNQVV